MHSSDLVEGFKIFEITQKIKKLPLEYLYEHPKGVHCTQFDHRMFQPNFRYRTCNFTHLCNFSRRMQWHYSIFQFLLYQCNKNEKNLNYLVKPHERFPFGSFYSVNGLLPKKTNLQHCQLFQITAFDCLSCLSYSSRRLVVFFH